VIESPGGHLDAPNPEVGASRDRSAMFENIASPGRLVAGIAALLLYMIFVIVLVRIRGGLRAPGRSEAV